MRIYGYQKTEVEYSTLIELSEITLCASSAKLRDIAAFLKKMADDMEKDDSFEHAHLQDNCNNWQISSTDITVCAVIMPGIQADLKQSAVLFQSHYK